MRDLSDTRVGHTRTIGDAPDDPSRWRRSSAAALARIFCDAQIRYAAAVREIRAAGEALVSATSEARTAAHETFVRNDAPDPSFEVNA